MNVDVARMVEARKIAVPFPAGQTFRYEVLGMKLLLIFTLAVSTAMMAADPKGSAKRNLDLNIATLPKNPTKDSVTQRDGSGRIVQQSNGSSTGIVTTRDSSGRVIATSNTTISGSSATTTHRDRSGKIMGTTYKSASGNETTRDASGRVQTTATTTTSGDISTTTYRDSSGRILGTKSVSSTGSITYRDRGGRITGPNFK